VSKDSTKVFVLSNRGVGDALLVRIEEGAEQCDAYCTNLDAAISELQFAPMMSNVAFEMGS